MTDEPLMIHGREMRIKLSTSYAVDPKLMIDDKSRGVPDNQRQLNEDDSSQLSPAKDDG